MAQINAVFVSSSDDEDYVRIIRRRKIIRRTPLGDVKRRLFANLDDGDNDDLSQSWSSNQPQASSTPRIDDEANNQWGSDVFYSPSSDDENTPRRNTGGSYVHAKLINFDQF